MHSKISYGSGEHKLWQSVSNPIKYLCCPVYVFCSITFSVTILVCYFWMLGHGFPNRNGLFYWKMRKSPVWWDPYFPHCTSSKSFNPLPLVQSLPYCSVFWLFLIQFRTAKCFRCANLLVLMGDRDWQVFWGPHFRTPSASGWGKRRFLYLSILCSRLCARKCIWKSNCHYPWQQAWRKWIIGAVFLSIGEEVCVEFICGM